MGLNDDRGNLTLKFVDIIEANDKIRLERGLCRTVVFWENVEGVLNDRTNAFGCLVSSLAGLDDAIQMRKWPKCGMVAGPKRSVAWRVLDAKFFGIPQQRRRIYLVAGPEDFHPEEVLFENYVYSVEMPSEEANLEFFKDGHEFRVFRSFTDCLDASYGTKWNGNAAALNGSRFVVQDGRIRRLSPLECERLMGFSDGYTDIPGASRTARYQSIGNSWAVPVIRWIGRRMVYRQEGGIRLSRKEIELLGDSLSEKCVFVDFGKRCLTLSDGTVINCSSAPNDLSCGKMEDIVEVIDDERLFISSRASEGMLRRKEGKNSRMNPLLEEFLRNIL